MRMLLSGVALVSVALVWCPALVMSNMSQLMQVSPTYSLRSFQIFGGSADNPGYMTPERFNNLTLMERQVAGLVIGRSIITAVQGVSDPGTYDMMLNGLRWMFPQQNWRVHKGHYAKNNNEDPGEAMAFFYRGDLVQASESGTWHEDNHVFFRPPIFARFHCRTCELKDFYLFGFHTFTGTVVQELNMMPDLYRRASNRFNNPNILFAGDMNAGYFVTSAQVDSAAPSSQPGFKWLIDNEVDSITTTQLDASIARFLACSENVANSFSGMGRAVEVQQWFGLTEAEAMRISAIKPVEVFLKKDTSIVARDNRILLDNLGFMRLLG